MKTKLCTHSDCRQVKPITEFYSDKRRKRRYMRSRRAHQTPEEKVAQKDGYREWRQGTPVREALRCARRRARKKKAPHGDPILLKEYAEILEGDHCAYCGRPMEHLDHIVPLDDQGVHDWTNLTDACGHCNSSKGADSLLVWML